MHVFFRYVILKQTENKHNTLLHIKKIIKTQHHNTFRSLETFPNQTNLFIDNLLLSRELRAEQDMR